MSLVLRVRQSYEDGTKHRKDVSLDEGHQELQTVHEEHHHETEQRQTRTQEGIQRPSDEDDSGERQDNGVTGHHVGKETDHQGEGLGDDTKDFDNRHDGCRISLQEHWYVGPEDFLPVFLVTEEVHGQHRTEGQEERDIDVTRYIGSTWEYG